MFRESIEGYVPHINNYHDPERVEDDAKGRWCCTVDKKHACEGINFFNFLEVHGSATWNFTANEDPSQRKVVFRVSNFNGNRFNGVIQLGDCAVLDRSQVEQVRDRLNELLKLMGPA